MELLYRQVFVLENLGFCIFSSFALLNNREVLELLAQMASDKFGVRVTAQELLSYAGDCIEQETAYQSCLLYTSENEEGTGRNYCGCDRSQHDNWLWGWCENRDSGKHRSRDNGGRDGTGYGKE